MASRGAEELLARAIDHHRNNRLDAAVAAYRKAIKRNPQLVEAHTNLGAALQALGQTRASLRSFRAATTLRPREPRVHMNLAAALVRAGEPDNALESYAAAYTLAPDLQEIRSRLVSTLRRSPLKSIGPAVCGALNRLTTDPEIELAYLVPAVVGCLIQMPAIGTVVDQLKATGAAEGDHTRAVMKALEFPALTTLCRDAVIADPDFERLVGWLRSFWLSAVMSVSETDVVPPSTVAAIALQMQATEWVYGEAEADAPKLEDLELRLSDPSARMLGSSPSLALLVYALFRPLSAFHDDTALLDRAADGDGSCETELLRRHLVDPQDDRRIAADLPALTPVAKGVSESVREQYEQSPYPRWRRLPHRAAQPVGRVLANALGDPDLAASVTITRPRILVAGCGTGRHACMTAGRFTGADVLAVDLSRRSLAYARRRSDALGLENIRFAQADISHLDVHDERYDIVESSGVLHHMADPEAGWRTLRGLVAPGGLMRIGLYSAHGRAGVDEGRCLVADRGGTADRHTIRKLRQEIRALPEGAPARMFAASADFYSVSGCRDLFLHAHEDRFTLPRIADALAQLDLTFLGFELPDPGILSLYRRQFPEDPRARDLRNWDALEAQQPTLFAAMYQFWCRTPL